MTSLQPSFRVGFLDDPLFREHDSGAGHPERPERLDAALRALDGWEYRQRVTLVTPQPATAEQVLRVHTQGHLALVSSTEGQTHRFDPDTQAGPMSYRAALLAAGAVVEAVDRVLEGELDRAFCAVRPPGHHAEADRAMGFCLLNNVAIGAAHALARGLSRVAIIDFDVHHGNGTQHIFDGDPRVLYLSSHAYPFYPGSGALDEVGIGAGRGFSVNLPLPAGCGDSEYAELYREIVVPVGRAFDPELVLVSAGFDPGRDDPLAPMDLTEQGFAEVSSACLRIAEGAARGRAVFVLEGGYNLQNIERGTAAILKLLLGEAHEPPGGGEPHRRITRLLEAYKKHLTRYWPVLASA
jgi:acetoin utilization deacetylase AcuC-like enzyme